MSTSLAAGSAVAAAVLGVLLALGWPGWLVAVLFVWAWGCVCFVDELHAEVSAPSPPDEDNWRH